MTLHSPFARHGAEFRIRGGRRSRQERRIPVDRRAKLETMREPYVETAAKCRGESNVREMVGVRQSGRLPERLPVTRIRVSGSAFGFARYSTLFPASLNVELDRTAPTSM